jgi:large subunit ribosomal protein L31
MKEGIHPTFYTDALVVCGSCGTTWHTGSTRKEIHVDVCSNCHPFFTGTQRIVDTAGQVERFTKRLAARETLAPTDGKVSKRERRAAERAQRSGMAEASQPEPEAPKPEPKPDPVASVAQTVGEAVGTVEAVAAEAGSVVASAVSSAGSAVAGAINSAANVVREPRRAQRPPRDRQPRENKPRENKPASPAAAAPEQAPSTDTGSDQGEPA